MNTKYEVTYLQVVDWICKCKALLKLTHSYAPMSLIEESGKNSPESSVFIHHYIVGEVALIKWLSIKMGYFIITTIGELISVP